MMTPASAIVAHVQPPRRHQRERPEGVVGRGSSRDELLEQRSAEELLWSAVLGRVLADSLCINIGDVHGATRTVLISRARTWLSSPSNDRDEVLVLSGIDPDWFHDHLPKLRRMWSAIDQGSLRLSVYGTPIGRAGH